MHELYHTLDTKWARPGILLVFLISFGTYLAWYFEWLRRSHEYNQYKNDLRTFNDHIKNALPPPQNQSTTAPTTPVTQIAGLCLPSCLASVVKRVHGQTSCKCNTNQYDDRPDLEERPQEVQSNANTSPPEQDSSHNDAISLPAEIDEVTYYLLNAEHTRLLLQERRLKKQVEDTEAALKKARTDNEDTRSELTIVNAELTKTKNQLGDKDSELEEANRLIELFKNQIYAVTLADQLQQENDGLREIQANLTGDVAELKRSEVRLTREVEQLRRRGSYLTGEVKKLRKSEAELKGELEHIQKGQASAERMAELADTLKNKLDRKAKALEYTNNWIKLFKEATDWSDDELKQALAKRRSLSRRADSKASTETSKASASELWRTITDGRTPNDSDPSSDVETRIPGEMLTDPISENQGPQQGEVISHPIICRNCDTKFPTRDELLNICTLVRLHARIAAQLWMFKEYVKNCKKCRHCD